MLSIIASLALGVVLGYMLAMITTTNKKPRTLAGHIRAITGTGGSVTSPTARKAQNEAIRSLLGY